MRLKSGASEDCPAFTAWLFTRLLVANLNSLVLVRVGLAGGILTGASGFLVNFDLMASTPRLFLMYCWPWFILALYLFITSGVLGMAAEVLAWYFTTGELLVLDLRK